MPGEKGLRATSPVHVHVEDDIPVHVHVKQKGKKVTKKVKLNHLSSIFCLFFYHFDCNLLLLINVYFSLDWFWNN